MATAVEMPRIQELQTMSIITPDARPTPLNTSIGREVRGLARNLTTELAAKTLIFNAPAPPAHRGQLEIIETTVLFNRH